MAEGAPVVTRAELLRRLNAGIAAVEAFLAGVPDGALREPGAVGSWSVADVLAHFVAHEQRALAELRAAGRGEHLAIDHAANDAFNDGAVQSWRALDPVTVRAAWGVSARTVVAVVAALADADFDPHGPLATALDDTIDGALANNTYGHYAEHLPEMESVVRSR